MLEAAFGHLAASGLLINPTSLSCHMAYRNGTYVAFHADGSANPVESDIRYYNLLKAWHVRDECDFYFVNSHEKTYAVRDSSSRETLRNRLSERLRNSKNMILVLGETTRFDTDWVPFEIEYAVDVCQIPIIAAYPGYINITRPWAARRYWPAVLEDRIDHDDAHVIHVPFRQAPLKDAVAQFSHLTYPRNRGLGRYSHASYVRWGLV